LTAALKGRGLVLAAVIVFTLAAWGCPDQARALEEGQGGITLGEAHFMVGNYPDASSHLLTALESSPEPEKARSYYLLGRISLLTGDLPQAKEYFERALDLEQAGSATRAMSLAGIGDTHLVGGLYEEALRRYRQAIHGSGSVLPRAHLEIKMSLAEHYLGREEEALARLSGALEQIPVMSHWLGREEDFYQSVAMTGMESSPERWVRFYVLVGPLSGKEADQEISGAGTGVSKVTIDGEVYREFGPFPDPVEAMIFSETARERYSAGTEVISR
jgi:tetratricopeptide (TPR) repeat protein